MEIADLIDKHRILSRTINPVINYILYLVRLVFKTIRRNGKNIVIVSLHKLGDSVFTIPAIKEIQKHYRKKIIIVCFPEVIPIYEILLSDVEYYKIEHNDFFFNGRIAKSKARKILNSANPDILFDFNGVLTSVSLILTTKARLIIGMCRQQFNKVYDYHTPIRRIPHMIDRYLDIVATVVPEFNDSERRKSISNFKATKLSEIKFLIQPFAGWKAKEWNLNKFVELAIKLSKSYAVAIVSPPKQISKDIIDELLKYNVQFFETHSIIDLIERLKECTIFIGNDSGPRQIASILEKPTFTIYGPTNPVYSVPIGEHHMVISKTLKCSPEENKDYCFTLAGLKGCPAFECMNLLTVQEVYIRLSNFVEQLKNN
ncbi:MAG: glycosyltransferase family 9 protein [Ignavibacteriaceae bacterium]